MWSNTNNWVHASAGSTQAASPPADMHNYLVLTATSQATSTLFPRIHLVTDTVRSLLVAGACSLKVTNRLELLDSVHVFSYALLEGPGYLAVNQELKLDKIYITNIHLTNSQNRRSALIGSWGSPPFPHEFDTLIMESPVGIEIENYIIADHIRFRRGIVEHAPGGINDFRRLQLTGTHDGASDSSHIKSHNKTFTWGFQDQRFSFREKRRSP